MDEVVKGYVIIMLSSNVNSSISYSNFTWLSHNFCATLLVMDCMFLHSEKFMVLLPA